MKKVVLTESQLKKIVYETAKKVVSRMNEIRRPYPTDMYGNYRSPHWSDETFGFKEYDTEAEAEGIQEMIQKVKEELLNPYTIKKAKRISGLRYSEMSLERFFREDARDSYYKALRYYLEPKSRETKEPTYICALKFPEMSPEEQLADITKYVTTSLKKEYGDTYDRYKKEFEYQSKKKGDIDADVDAFVQKHGEVNPESMTYVQLIGLDKELKTIGVGATYGETRGGGSYRGMWYYDDILKYLNRGQLKDLISRVDDEVKKRRDAAPNYNIGYLNKFDPHYHTSQAEYDEWNELQALMKKYKHFNVGGTDNHRGDSATWGDLVDENGELVCTYSYQVDSSD